jgi:hypothetical protein
MRAGTQQLERRLVANLYSRSGDQRVVTTEISALLALGIVEVTACTTHRVVVAMHRRERLLADIASALLLQCRLLAEIFGTGCRQPQRCVLGGLTLHAQPCLLDHLAIVLLGERTIGFAKRLRHSHQRMSLGLRHESRQGQQLAPLCR